MAGQKVSVNLEVSDQSGSIKKRTSEAKELNKELSKAAQTAERAMSPMAAARGPRGEGTAYGQARGTAGATGASARDFANQAQGLGGLVRTYATVAANLYAVGAAFNALKDAANVTNMINGMNQLGSVTGVALGSIAQRLVQATDGAVTLREAISTVTKASAAGLGSKQILEIGQIAKTASQALGIDMSDAISRLTRGITKLEPELLDELGLFTKIGPATEKYALQLGKSAASLTDFERRQAFANAVLQEGREKFGALQLDANPYQKLEASVRNLATAGLELINKFLVPLVSLFTNNTGLLVGGLGLFAAKLISQAVPALVSWRGELTKSAKLAKDKAKEINELYGERSAQKSAIDLNIPKLEKDLKTQKDKLATAQKDIAEFQKQSSLRTTRTIRAAEAGTFGQDPKDISRVQAQIRGLKDTGAEAQAYKAKLTELKDAAQAAAKAEKELTAALNQQEQQLKRRTIGEWARERISRAAGARAERLSILSQVGENVQGGGFFFAMSKMREELNKTTDLGKFAKFRTAVSGAMIGAASSVGILTRALGGVGAAFATLTAVFGILRSEFGKNQKEQAIFDAAVESNKATVITATKSLERYRDTINTLSLVARGNIFKQLDEDLQGLTASFDSARQKANWIDNVWEGILTITPFVRSSFQELSRQVGDNLAKQLEIVPAGPAKEALRQKLKEILETEDLSEEGIREAAKRIGKEKIRERIDRAGAVFIEQRNAVIQAGQRSQDFADKMKLANEEASKLIQSLAQTDPIAKFGQGLVNLGIGFKTVAGDVDQSIAALKKTLEDPKALQLIDPGSVQILKDLAKQLPEIEKQVVDSNKVIAEAQKERGALERRRQDLQPGVGTGMARAYTEEDLKIEKQLQKARQTEAEAADSAARAKLNLSNIQSELTRIGNKAIEQGFKLIQGAAQRAMQQANIDIRKNLLQGLTGPEIIERQAKLDIESIELRKQEIIESAKLVETMIKSNILAESRLAFDQARAIEEAAAKRGTGLSDAEKQLFDKLMRTSQELAAVGSSGPGGKLTGTYMPMGATELANVQQGGPITQSTLGPEAAGRFTELAMQRRATASKLIAENSKAQLINDTKDIQVQEARAQLQRDFTDRLNKLNDLAKEYYELQIGTSEILTDQQLNTKFILENQQQSRRQAAEQQAIYDQIENLAVRLTKASGEEAEILGIQIRRQSNTMMFLTEQAELEKTITEEKQRQARVANYYAQVKRELDAQNKIQDAIIDQEDQLFATKNDIIQLERQLTYQTEERTRLQDLEIRREEILREANRKRQELERNQVTLTAEAYEKVVRAKFSPEAEAQYIRDTERLNELFDVQLGTIDKITASKLRGVDIQKQLTPQVLRDIETFKSLENVATGVVDKMTDAFMEFAKTGKFSFKDMANAIIADIGRIIIRAQMMKFMESTFGTNWAGDFAGGFGRLLGIGGSGLGYGTAGTAAALPVPAGVIPPLAKGGIIDSTGIQKFAQGGMFTNKIVAQPTLFKFAQGTGLMGEAGPEAIMPLRRDGEGNLGVIGKPQGGSVEVVVNNYSGERAEARETMDSRGNRKIEVVVGEMVAQEVNRKNSPMQQSIQGNFNTRPSVIRR